MSNKLVRVQVKHLVISSAQQGSNNDDSCNVDIASIGDVNVQLDVLEDQVYQWQAASYAKSTINQKEFSNVINMVKKMKKVLKREDKSFRTRIDALTHELETIEQSYEDLSRKYDKLQTEHNELQEKSDKKESLLVLGDLLRMYRFYYVDADLVAANKQWRVAVNEFSNKKAELKDGDIDESQFQAWSTQFVNQYFPRLQNLKLEEIIHYGRQRNGEAHTELFSKVDQQAFLLKTENEFVFATEEFGDVAGRLLTELKKVTLAKMTS